jgi:hypothetical protein
MHADGIGVGVETDQQKINGSTAAETVLHGFPEIKQALIAG